jgi:pSer/pThr/pTyr-binding forkhead associated (FHA) protein
MILRLTSIDAALVDAPPHLMAGDTYKVGRSKHCVFVLNDRSVSRTHAEVTAQDGSVLIMDVGSTNGTFVDDQRIVEPTQVKPGQAIRFGRVLFHLTRNELPVGSEEDSSTISAHSLVHNPRSTGEFPALKGLSAAERPVMDLLLTGLSQKEIASKLKKSEHTVHNHIKAIYKKMGVNSCPELLALFVAYSKAPKT